jgi:hypothetical protein
MSLQPAAVPKLDLSPRNNVPDTRQSPKRAEYVHAEGSLQIFALFTSSSCAFFAVSVAPSSPKQAAPVSPKSPSSSSPRKSPRSLKSLFSRSPPPGFFLFLSLLHFLTHFLSSKERIVLDGPLQQDLQQRQMIEEAMKKKKKKDKKDKKTKK